MESNNPHIDIYHSVLLPPTDQMKFTMHKIKGEGLLHWPNIGNDDLMLFITYKKLKACHKNSC